MESARSTELTTSWYIALVVAFGLWTMMCLFVGLMVGALLTYRRQNNLQPAKPPRLMDKITKMMQDEHEDEHDEKPIDKMSQA